MRKIWIKPHKQKRKLRHVMVRGHYRRVGETFKSYAKATPKEVYSELMEGNPEMAERNLRICKRKVPESELYTAALITEYTRAYEDGHNIFLDNPDSPLVRRAVRLIDNYISNHSGEPIQVHHGVMLSEKEFNSLKAGSTYHMGSSLVSTSRNKNTAIDFSSTPKSKNYTPKVPCVFSGVTDRGADVSRISAPNEQEVLLKSNSKAKIISSPRRVNDNGYIYYEIDCEL